MGTIQALIILLLDLRVEKYFEALHLAGPRGRLLEQALQHIDLVFGLAQLDQHLPCCKVIALVAVLANQSFGACEIIVRGPYLRSLQSRTLRSSLLQGGNILVKILNPLVLTLLAVLLLEKFLLGLVGLISLENDHCHTHRLLRQDPEFGAGARSEVAAKAYWPETERPGASQVRGGFLADRSTTALAASVCSSLSFAQASSADFVL